MWGRLRRARIRRQCDVRLRVQRRDPVLARGVAPSRRAPGRVGRFERAMRRLARGGLARWRRGGE